jgi:hypothetical protein
MEACCEEIATHVLKLGLYLVPKLQKCRTKSDARRYEHSRWMRRHRRTANDARSSGHGHLSRSGPHLNSLIMLLPPSGRPLHSNIPWSALIVRLWTPTNMHFENNFPTRSGSNCFLPIDAPIAKISTQNKKVDNLNRTE